MTECLNFRQAAFCIAASKPVPDRTATRPSRPFLTARTPHFMIYLESAAFVFHINTTTPESSGHCEPRVLSPSNGFWLAPSANQNRRPKHAGVSDTPRALLADIAGRLPFIMERTTF